MHPVFLKLNLKLMKKLLLFVFMCAGIQILNAQPTKTVTPAAPGLKTSTDSLSYVLGEVAAFHLMQQGLGNIKLNNESFVKGVTDILSKNKPMIDDATANSLLNSYMTRQQTMKAQANIDAGKKFLDSNKLKPGVKTTA